MAQPVSIHRVEPFGVPSRYRSRLTRSSSRSPPRSADVVVATITQARSLSETVRSTKPPSPPSIRSPPRWAAPSTRARRPSPRSIQRCSSGSASSAFAASCARESAPSGSRRETSRPSPHVRQVAKSTAGKRPDLAGHRSAPDAEIAPAPVVSLREHERRLARPRRDAREPHADRGSTSMPLPSTKMKRWPPCRPERGSRDSSPKRSASSPSSDHRSDRGREVLGTDARARVARSAPSSSVAARWSGPSGLSEVSRQPRTVTLRSRLIWYWLRRLVAGDLDEHDAIRERARGHAARDAHHRPVAVVERLLAAIHRRPGDAHREQIGIGVLDREDHDVLRREPPIAPGRVAGRGAEIGIRDDPSARGELDRRSAWTGSTHRPSGLAWKRTWNAVPGCPARGPNQRASRSGSWFRGVPAGRATLQNSFANRNCQTAPSGSRTSVSPSGTSARSRGGSFRIGSRWFQSPCRRSPRRVAGLPSPVRGTARADSRRARA